VQKVQKSPVNAGENGASDLSGGIPPRQGASSVLHFGPAEFLLERSRRLGVLRVKEEARVRKDAKGFPAQRPRNEITKGPRLKGGAAARTVDSLTVAAKDETR